jgi:O-antigen ligase
MRSWQYYVGVRLEIFDLLLLLFTMSYITYLIVGGRASRPPIPVLNSLRWLRVIFILSSFSIIPVIHRSLPGSIEMFAKGWVNLGLWVAGFHAMAYYVASGRTDFPKKLLKIYIIGVVASCVYSVFEVVLASRGIDIGKIVFGSISVYRPGQYNPDQPFYYAWDNFFRAVGFAGVNAQATYAVSAIPLLLFAKPFRSKTANHVMAAVCSLGLVLTMSRTGLLALVTAVGTYFILRARGHHIYRWVFKIGMLALPLIVLAMAFPSKVSTLLGTREYHSISEVGSGRKEIYWETFKHILIHPFGEGINQFSVVTRNTDLIDFSAEDALYPKWSPLSVLKAYENIHNSYLTILFDGGWLLLFAYIAYFGSILRICLAGRSDLGVAGLCSLSGLLAGGLTNNTLDQFSTQLLFILLALAVVAERQGLRDHKAFRTNTRAGMHEGVIQDTRRLISQEDGSQKDALPDLA